MKIEINKKYSEVVYRTDTNRYGGAIYCDLECFGKVIGSCTLYIPNQIARDEGLDFYFDDIDPVATVHYNKFTSTNNKEKTFLDKQKFVYLTDMYVKPEYRNMEAGSDIITQVKEFIRLIGIEHLFLVSAIYKDNKDQGKIDNFYYKNKFKPLTDEGLSGKLMHFHVTSESVTL